MSRERAIEMRGRSVTEVRKLKLFIWMDKLALLRKEAEASAEGSRRSSSMMSNGGAQTRRREASIEKRKKTVLIHRHGRVQRRSLKSFFSI